MQERQGKVYMMKAGGNASANAMKYRVEIPVSWVKEMGINYEDRQIKLMLTDEKKVIIEKI